MKFYDDIVVKFYDDVVRIRNEIGDVMKLINGVDIELSYIINKLHELTNRLEDEYLCNEDLCKELRSIIKDLERVKGDLY